MRQPIPARVGILSSATRAAIEDIGGLENAEAVTRVRRSQLSRCQSANDEDVISAIDALALDDATLGRGGPHILTAMARMLGHVLIPVPVPPDDHDRIAEQMMVVTGDLGAASTEIVEALRDGTIDKHEALRAADKVDELLTSATALRGLLLAIAWPGEGKS